ncbi:hypothetical protein SARC_14015 [Sphaeroforma arctica JP610]|uniref:Uncharacterized protein n=1 Tax=Sphaeroforma arctica JP610 TaxID=667725 RepID=A0A0L0FBF4_9EUKA|nr:hypothetical protein SARC_14015 [Sphaeroforma arctica JP610]KNC73428.1 hypothetical protein SARC_14015 [Sphaeroforma arctica JP610]|eukprot:XP_014147330.1 hypothetical protein SARC_14015 [Sphaeroforma arctica JP610]
MRNYPLWRASKNGHTDVVRLLLGSDKVNPGDDKSVALRVACEEGHIEIVRMMLALPHTQFVDPGIENGFCLRKAIDNRHSEVVRMLLQDMRVDPSADHNSALQIACERNDPAVVQLLLNNPAVDPTMDNSNCLVLASKAGNLAAVLVLLADGRVNANARTGFALKAANSRKHKEVARLLKAYMRGGTAAVSDNITKARQSFSGESMIHRTDSVVPVSARASCPQDNRRTSEEELADRRGSTLAYFSDLIMGKRKSTESGSVGSSKANTGRRPTKSAAV